MSDQTTDQTTQIMAGAPSRNLDETEARAQLAELGIREPSTQQVHDAMGGTLPESQSTVVEQDSNAGADSVAGSGVPDTGSSTPDPASASHEGRIAILEEEVRQLWERLAHPKKEVAAEG